MNAFSKITAVCLAIVFLLSGLGFTANKMICLKSGKIKVSLVSIKDCCTEKKSSKSTIKSQCCDISNTSFHLNDFNFTQKNNIPVATIFVLPIVELSLKQGIFSNTSSSLSFADLPPPLHGRQLLSFIHILII